jgi:hypothetical protein
MPNPGSRPASVAWPDPAQWSDRTHGGASGHDELKRGWLGLTIGPWWRCTIGHVGNTVPASDRGGVAHVVLSRGDRTLDASGHVRQDASGRQKMFYGCLLEMIGLRVVVHSITAAASPVNVQKSGWKGVTAILALGAIKGNGGQPFERLSTLGMCCPCVCLVREPSNSLVLVRVRIDCEWVILVRLHWEIASSGTGVRVASWWYLLLLEVATS